MCTEKHIFLRHESPTLGSGRLYSPIDGGVQSLQMNTPIDGEFLVCFPETETETVFFFFCHQKQGNSLVFLQNQELCENEIFFPPGRKRSLRFAQASLSGEAKGQIAR